MTTLPCVLMHHAPLVFTHHPTFLPPEKSVQRPPKLSILLLACTYLYLLQPPFYGVINDPFTDHIEIDLH